MKTTKVSKQRRLVVSTALYAVVLSVNLIACQRTKFSGEAVKPVAAAAAPQPARPDIYIPPEVPQRMDPQPITTVEPVDIEVIDTPTRDLPPPRPTAAWHEIQPLPPEPAACVKNCGTQIVALPAPPPAEDCRENGECRPPEPVKKFCDVTDLKGEKQTAALDILFVVDTSASLRGGTYKNAGGEVAQLAREMPAFVSQLDPNTDYRIGVLLGHGPRDSKNPKSMTNVHGELFSFGATDPTVISFKEIYDQEKSAGGTAQQIRKRVELLIADRLTQKMIQLPTDRTSAQGETLLLSLYNAVAKKDLRQKIINQGMFRKDAALAIIMVSDEQDVCFDYTGTPYTPHGKKVTDKKTKKTTYIVDKAEVATLNGICKTAANGSPLTSNLVYDQLKALKGEKLIVTGIIYNNDKTIPAVGIEDENEMGHGFIELIQLAGGESADLATVDRAKASFSKQLTSLGRFADFQMRYRNSFQCSIDGVHPRAANKSTVEVQIKAKGTNKEIVSFKSNCTSGPNCATPAIKMAGNGDYPHLEVSVPYQTLNQALKAKNYPEADVHISFFTSSDVDPATGEGGNEDNKPKKQSALDLY